MKLKTLANFGYILAIIVVLSFGLMSAYPILNKKSPLRLFVVESGSMEPALKMGSVVFVLPKSPTQKTTAPIPWPAYQEGEIITYLAGQETTTHRIIRREISEKQFLYQTQGDAVQSADLHKVSEEKVLGRVIFSIPYLGHLLSYSRSQAGFIFLIIVPATLIIHSEFLNIKKELKKMFTKRGKKATVP